MLNRYVRFGLPLKYQLPLAIEESSDTVSDDSRGLERYAEFGFAIARNLVPPSLCDLVVAGFRREVKSFAGPFLRQASARLSPHQFTSDGFMANALLSVQDLVKPEFRRFRTSAIDVIAGARTQAVVRELLNEKPLLVESMFFESTLVGIPLHADGDYMDSEVRGTMVGAWFALEDILPLSGRFVVVPGSHRLEQETSKAAAVYRDFRMRHAETSATIVADVRKNLRRRFEEAQLLHQALLESGLQIIAPMLNKGDALFWGAGLIHGSLPPESTGQSRNSLTAHYIGSSRAFMVHGRCADFPTETHHGMKLRVMRQSGTRKWHR
jgi:ectoine hydroxylase-related dioxygenase (phytanoyl-CoA dioxygenase family)